MIDTAKAGGAYRPPALRGKPYTYKLVGHQMLCLSTSVKNHVNMSDV